MRTGVKGLILAAYCGLSLSTWAQGGEYGAGEGVPPLRPKHISSAAAAGIDRGLAYLARNQSRDGSWRNNGPLGTYPVSMTSLAGLALLADGNTTTQGRYAENVDRAARFLLRSRQSSGLISRPEEEARSMYGHGFSMLFLGELLGMEEDARRMETMQRALSAAVELTAASQSRAGGWIYTPDGGGDEGSVTITQVQGLRACRNAGIAVPRKVIDRAMNYLEDSVLPDGGIAYRAGMGGNSRPPITAAAVACWFNAGEYENKYAQAALDYCRERITAETSPQELGGHYFYAHLYMAQIMYLSGGADWDGYFPSIRKYLVSIQGEDGSWLGDQVGRTYGTAIALIILQLPYNQLPIFQR